MQKTYLKLDFTGHSANGVGIHLRSQGLDQFRDELVGEDHALLGNHFDRYQGTGAFKDFFQLLLKSNEQLDIT